MEPTFILALELKLDQKLLGLNDKSKAAVRNKLPEVKSLITDERPMLLSDLWTNIDSRLGEVFMTILQNAFAGLSVTTVADFLQLLTV